MIPPRTYRVRIHLDRPYPSAMSSILMSLPSEGVEPTAAVTA